VKGRLFFKIGGWAFIASSVVHMIGQSQGMGDAANEQERQLIDLMTNYRIPLPGAQRSMLELFDGLGLAFSTFLLFAGLAALVAARRQTVADLRTSAILNAGLAGIGLGISLVKFFLIPQVCFAVIFLSFVAAIALLREETT
jgi:hypothetical protein